MATLRMVRGRVIGQGLSVKTKADGTQTITSLAPSAAKAKAKARRRAASKAARASRRSSR